MGFKDWKDQASKMRNSEGVASLLSSIKEKLTPIMVLGSSGGTSDMVGLDIGTSRIKLLKINSNTTPYQVDIFASADLPPGAVVKDEIKDATAIGLVLKSMLREHDVTAKYAALAIPRSLAIIKNITVDKRLNAKDIESRAWIEANRHFPDLIGDIYLDFTITGPSLQEPDQLDLLLVACRKEHIQPYLDIVHQSGLTAKIVDVNCYALERALQLIVTDEPDLHTVALLNVNISQSSLVVLSKQHLIHAHDQAFDGQRLLKQVDEYLKDKQAQPGMGEAPLTINDATYHALLQTSLLSHLRHTVHFFYSSRPNISIQKIFLAGDCSSIPDVAAFVEKEIGIKTVLADPFINMSVASLVAEDELKKQASGLMLCSGLALSGVGS